MTISLRSYPSTSNTRSRRFVNIWPSSDPSHDALQEYVKWLGKVKGFVDV